MESFRQLVRQYQSLVLLTLSGFIVPLITNLFSSWLEAAFGETPAQLLQILALFVFLAITLWVLVLLFRRTQRSGVLVPKELQASPHAGLIVLVGPGRVEAAPGPPRNVAEEAIEYHLKTGSLQRVWLVTSDAGVRAAEELRARYADRLAIEVCLIHNILDVNETYRAVRAIYDQAQARYRLPPEEIIADYTGGTSPMKVGMALAATSGPTPYPMQFTSGKPNTLSVPIQTDFERQEPDTPGQE